MFCDAAVSPGIARSRSCWKDVRGDCGDESLWQWFRLVLRLNPLSANPTKWSNTLKTIRPLLRRIVWVCLTILWGWLLKVNAFCRSPILQKQFIITSVGCFYRGSSFSEHYFLKIPERSSMTLKHIYRIVVTFRNCNLLRIFPLDWWPSLLSPLSNLKTLG